VAEPHWAFQPLTHPAPPPVARRDWPRHDLDRFVLPRSRAGRPRAGTGSGPADLAAPGDPRPHRTPAPPPTTRPPSSPTPGPTPTSGWWNVSWPRRATASGGRNHWLDVVRYADTHGFEVNTERTNAWPYRDYVIRAFNRDLPYDRFVRDQIAGDLAGEDAATGFLVTASVLLPGQIGADEPSKRLARQDALDEIVVNVSQTFLGLGVGCARCHDHKSDPISQRDYYALQAFVAGVEYEERDLPSPETGTTRRAFAGLFRKPDLIRVLRRGNPEQPGDETTPAIPTALGSLRLPADAPEAERRRVLADWIADPAHPLTARVMANRIWQGPFRRRPGRHPQRLRPRRLPAERPATPRLARREFIRGGWSIKHLHRVIVLSATYRQSSRIDPPRRRPRRRRPPPLALPPPAGSKPKPSATPYSPPAAG
jgi:hypothetical protein